MREPMMTENDMAFYLGLSKRTLRQWRLEGRGPRFFKVGRHVRYDPADLEIYKQQTRREPLTTVGQERNVRISTR